MMVDAKAAARTQQLACLRKHRVRIGMIAVSERSRHPRYICQMRSATTFELGSTASSFTPIVHILYHDASIDAAKIRCNGNLKRQLLRQHASYQIGKVTEHPLYQKDGRKAIYGASSVVFVQLRRLGKEPYDERERTSHARYCCSVHWKPLAALRI